LRSALAALLLLAGCATDAPPAATRLSTADALLARLPDSVGGFRRGATTPLTDPAPGSEVAYATANRAIAGYVQVLRRAEPLPAGTAAAELRRFVAEAATGSSRRMRERAPPTLAGLDCAELEGTYGRQAVESLACAGVFGGQLVRLRLTMVRRGERMAEARGFAEGVAAALR